jgi:hypothetical protein
MIKMHSLWIATNKNGIIYSDACTETYCKQYNMWPTYAHANSLCRQEQMIQMHVIWFIVKTRRIVQRHSAWFLVNYSNAHNLIHCKEEWNSRFVCNVIHSKYSVIQEKAQYFRRLYNRSLWGKGNFIPTCV